MLRERGKVDTLHERVLRNKHLIEISPYESLSSILFFFFSF